MYIAYFNVEGHRITTIVEGIHYQDNDKEEVVNKYLESYKKEYGEEIFYREITEEQQFKLTNEPYIWDRDTNDIKQYVPPSPPEPTAEDVIEENKANAEETVDKVLADAGANLDLLELVADLNDKVDQLMAKDK